MKLKLVYSSLVLIILFTSAFTSNAQDVKTNKKVTIETPKKEEKKAETKKDVKAEKQKCEAMTKKGTQCSRNATAGKFCKQHTK
ncbi:MAG: hypothetical protein NTW25_15575 [Candidatus Kapabacteria bacterium]|nr:hypothetical protein [Candidatus Kapabacteria bacterium]